MRIVIIEDEIPALKRLKSLILEIVPDCEIVASFDEITQAVEWFKTQEHPDLVFMDIQLADGYSFEIFERTEIKSAVIFATAFDQYAIEAFKVNGLDYLLKPIKKEELVKSFERFKSLKKPASIDLETIKGLIAQKQENYKKRFLVKSGDQLNFVKIDDIAYFLSEGSYSFLVAKSGNRFIMDETLDNIQLELDPKYFFRINRNKIVGVECIDKISTHFNNRLKLDLLPVETNETLVSRAKVKEFKDWLNQ
jgi:two-component system, LytTR family, response regulator